MEAILDQLLNLSTESEVVEFKKATQQYDKDKLGKYFSALSNEANLAGKEAAWLVLGVDNGRSITGTKITENQLNNYKKEIADHTSPRINFISANRIEREGKAVILLKIPAAPKGHPVAWKGHWYGRDGESLGALTSEEYERIKNQIQRTDWSAEIIETATIKDLSSEAIKQARFHFTQKNPKLKNEITTWSDKQFLNKAKITINGKITNTAILLLGKPESEHYINPSRPTITWILKDKDDIEKDYEHFTCPLLLSVEEVRSKIRNLKYRYISSETLFPDEVEQYDPFIIREGLNNCIAHQNYTLGGKIIVLESENSSLTFSNLGEFIPITVDAVIHADAPEQYYRNTFLTNAMVGLNMIDTVGSGIRRMFRIQSKKFFPLPEYDLSKNKVKVAITGKVLDMNYARKLAQFPGLTLDEIILLDKVAKNKPLKKEEARSLKAKKLIEGRRPNFYIASNVAKATDEKGTYIKQRAFDDPYYYDLVVEYLKKFKQATRAELRDLLLEKLPDVLDDNQKENKIKNLLQKMRRSGVIINAEQRNWILNENLDKS